MLRLVTAAALLTVVTTAYAGLDCADDDSDIKDLETYAKTKTAIKDDEVWRVFACTGNPKYRARIEKACGKIIARDGAKSQCWEVAAAAGITKIGTYDIFDWVAKLPENPINLESRFLYRPDYFSRMKDPRGAAEIIKLWKETIPRAEGKRVDQVNWNSWRQRAARALGELGGKDDIAFLDEQAKGAAKDKYVMLACKNAIAQIEKRVAAAAPKP